MRVLKFRIWDKENKQIHYCDAMGIMDNGIWFENSNFDTDNHNDDEAADVMQFTGLHDRNGKEIYEGDILELVGGTCNFLPCGIYNDQRYGIGDKMIVQKLKSGFTLCGMNMYDCDIPNRVGKVDNYTFWNHQSSLKIIGNIYKNPELM